MQIRFGACRQGRWVIVLTAASSSEKNSVKEIRGIFSWLAGSVHQGKIGLQLSEI
jgi:hypothetical protein